MSVDLKVVPIHEGPALDEIPAQLRALADRIEAGEYGDVSSLLAVLPRERTYPVTFGWGDIRGCNEPVVQFELARQWHVRSWAGLPVD